MTTEDLDRALRERGARLYIDPTFGAWLVTARGEEKKVHGVVARAALRRDLVVSAGRQGRTQILRGKY